MITEPGGARIWRVRLRSHTSRGEWHFVDRDRAQRFVESKLGHRNTMWARKHSGKWVTEHNGKTYTVESIEVYDAAGIVIDENATHPP